MEKIPLIMSCDTKNEIDDQFAISYALKSPEINLLGVVSVQNQKRNGKNSTSIYHEEALKIIALSGSKTPAFKGSKKPLKSKEKPEISDGVEFIIKEALASKSKLFIACTGPCTDLANAILLEPKIKEKCVFIWLGGFKNHEEALRTNYKEINYNGDRLAAHILMESEIDLVLLPMWGVTDCLITSCYDFQEKLQEKDNPLNQYLLHLTKTNHNRLPFNKLYPHYLKRYWVFADVAAVAAVKELGILNTEDTMVKIEKGKIKYFQNLQGRTKIITKIDSHKIFNDIFKCILN